MSHRINTSGHRRPSNRRPLRKQFRGGAMMVTAGVVLVLFMIIAGFAVEQARQQLIGYELDGVTEAACRAAALELARSGDRGRAVEAGIELASKNCRGDIESLSADDFRFGRIGPPDLESGLRWTDVDQSPNAVRLKTRSENRSLFARALRVLPGNFSRDDGASAASVAMLPDRDIVAIIDVLPPTYSSELENLLHRFREVRSVEPWQQRVGWIDANERRIVRLCDGTSPDIAGSTEADPADWSDLASGIAAARRMMELNRSHALVQRSIVIVTANTDFDEAAENVLRRAEDDSIQIHTITITDRVGPSPSLPAIGRGRHLRASTPAELLDAARTIVSSPITLRIE